MSVTIGTQLGSHEITALLGKGGMGEVWRARDTKLKREVAIKILPDEFSRDPNRLARFEREAEVLASLNHPNIAAIYEFVEAQGSRFLVLELVEGETLAERIKRGPIPVDEALSIANSICDALEAAHEKGIVHRDLKPANVKITHDGKVKILDFGLAKAMEQTPATTLSNSPTLLSMAATNAGVILGTAAYMSPEQAAGKPVDKRTDIWSFGVVLWEMLTGKGLFEGETVSHTLAAVLTKDPDWTQLPAGTPAAARRLLRRCLERERKRRLPDIGAARLEIEEAKAGGPVDDAATAVAPRRSILPWVAAGLFAAATLVLVFLHFDRSPESPHVYKFSVLLPENATFSEFEAPAVSPDGRRLVFPAILDDKEALWMRDLDSLTTHLLPGTEGGSQPFWSPDSRLIAFFANGKLKKVDVAGGLAVTLCDAPDPRGGAWSKNDVILFAPTNGSPLLRVPAAGGNATPETEINRAMGEASHREPSFLPDGRHFLYSAAGSDRGRSAVYVGDLDSKSRVMVVPINSNAVYASPGYILFMQKGTLMAQAFDAGTLRTSGDAVPIVEQVRSEGNAIHGQFSVSQNGVLVYLSGTAWRNVEVTWFDRSGKASGILGPPGEKEWAKISPDGSTVAMDRRDPQTGIFDIWLHNLTRGTDSRLTFGPSDSRFPVWSPDGGHIAFLSGADLYQKAIGGTAQDTTLEKGVNPSRWARDWSRDGRYIIEEEGLGHIGIWALPLFGDRKPFRYLQNEFRGGDAKLSPNGQWMAYSSNETGRYEVYVATFPTPTGKWQVSTNGGRFPVWSRDGKELFFIALDRNMMAAAVSGASSKFEAGVPKPLFATRLAQLNPMYDVSEEGRFLIPTEVERENAAAITAVVNWTVELKK